MGVPLCCFFFGWEGPPPKIDYRKTVGHPYSNLTNIIRLQGKKQNQKRKKQEKHRAPRGFAFRGAEHRPAAPRPALRRSGRSGRSRGVPRGLAAGPRGAAEPGAGGGAARGVPGTGRHADRAAFLFVLLVLFLGVLFF